MIDEAAGSVVVGGPEVLSAGSYSTSSQRRSDWATWQSESCRSVWPCTQGLDGTFWIFRLPEPYPAVAYVESLGGRLYLESPKV